MHLTPINQQFCCGFSCSLLSKFIAALVVCGSHVSRPCFVMQYVVSIPSFAIISLLKRAGWLLYFNCL